MPRKTVTVKLKWIGDAIAVNPKGGCDFHMHEDGSGKFHAGCGCCQLARAFIKAGGKARSRPIEIHMGG